MAGPDLTEGTSFFSGLFSLFIFLTFILWRLTFYPGICFRKTFFRSFFRLFIPCFQSPSSSLLFSFLGGGGTFSFSIVVTSFVAGRSKKYLSAKLFPGFGLSRICIPSAERSERRRRRRNRFGLVILSRTQRKKKKKKKKKSQLKIC